MHKGGRMSEDPKLDIEDTLEVPEVPEENFKQNGWKHCDKAFSEGREA